MRALASTLAASLLLSAPAARAAGEAPAWDNASIQRELRAFVEVHRGAPGVVVGLVDRTGRRVLVAGESGRKERPHLDGSTRFEIGSITKTFTGALFADMILSGEVTPDQKVATLFPKDVALRNGAEEVTLEALATHTSGLPRLAVDPLSLARTLSVDPYRGSTASEVFHAVARVPKSLLRPTESLAYSNLGFALLGRLLERRAGEPYESLLRRRVLEPLGLSGIATGHTGVEPPALARGHGSGGRPAAYWHVDGYAPAGGLIASVDELLEYVSLNLVAGTVRPGGPGDGASGAAGRPALAEAQRPRRTFANGRQVGLGWMHAIVGGHRLVWHNGGTGGFRTFAGFLPEEGRAFVVLANGHGDVDALARRLLDPAEPPLPAHASSAAGWTITLALLAWGPLLLFQSIRGVLRTGAEGRIDRLDVLRGPLSPAIALILAERIGAWLDVPHAAWWGALGLSLAAYAFLAWRAAAFGGGAPPPAPPGDRGIGSSVAAAALPWRRGGSLSVTGRAAMTLLEIAVLAALLWRPA